MKTISKSLIHTAILKELKKGFDNIKLLETFDTGLLFHGVEVNTGKAAKYVALTKGTELYAFELSERGAYSIMGKL